MRYRRTYVLKIILAFKIHQINTISNIMYDNIFVLSLIHFLLKKKLEKKMALQKVAEGLKWIYNAIIFACLITPL